jgi:hypothetical protein
MPRDRRKARENWTAEEIIAHVIQWANQQQLAYVTAALRQVLHLLKTERAGK